MYSGDGNRSCGWFDNRFDRCGWVNRQIWMVLSALAICIVCIGLLLPWLYVLNCQ